MAPFASRLFDRYDREVVSLAVLADERPAWRPSQFGYGRWGCRLAFEFPVVKLLDRAADLPALEAEPNPFAAFVLAHLLAQQTRQDPERRRVWKVRLIRGLYERGLGAEDIRRLFRLVDWLMELPPALEQQMRHELQQYEEEKQMPYISSIERIGREEGRQEGRLEGRQEGRTEGLLRGIETALALRFGEAGVRLLPEVRLLHDPDRLEAILTQIPTVATPEDLRRLWQ
ncbi:MAG TPA: hypothetical protein VFA18_10570 [Gemmataceae bacterium]|nr:hypothetical protein [Gemmataceae bacterium]